MHKQLNKGEASAFAAQVESLFPHAHFLTKHTRIEQHDDCILIDGSSAFFQHNGRLIPLLRFVLKNDSFYSTLKKVTVDKGAIKFLTSGADVMRPGVTHCDPLVQKDELVLVIDETHKKPLAIGVALLSSQDLLTAASGKVIKSLHYVGDKLWQQYVK